MSNLKPHQISDVSPQFPGMQINTIDELCIDADAKVERNEINAAAIEQAYRRGYCQGYFRGSEDQRSYPQGKVDEFFNSTLFKWRYETVLRFKQPPEM